VIAILITAIVTGSVYGLIGTGLVLTYNTSGIFNFAYGAMASVGVYLYLYLRADAHLPLVVCLLLCLVVLPVVMGPALEPFAQRLSQKHLTIQVAGTIGLYLLVEAIAEIQFGVSTQFVPTFLPTGEVTILGARVGVSQIITLVVSIVAVVALNAMLHRTRRGVEMRAVVDNSDLLAISGGSPSATRRIAWTISSFLVILSGLLIAPSIGIDPQDLTSLAILAFAAAAFGGFKSINIAYLGGMAVAIPEDLLERYINSSSLLGSLSQNLPFILLVLVILLYPKRAFLRAKLTEPKRRITGSVHLPARMEVLIGIVVLAVLILVPEFAGFRITAWAASMATLVLLLSLGMLVRLSGQVSLCQIAFAAIGVSAFALLTDHAHLPWLLALVLSGLIAVPFALVLAIPAIRLSGLYLALGTFGFGYALLNMFYQSNLMFGPGEQGLTISTPSVSFINFGSSNVIYYFLLIFVAIATIVVVTLERTRCGRLLRGMADSRLGLETLGVSISFLQMVVFAVSAFLAGIAGVLIGVAFLDVSGTSYWPDTSMLYFVVLVIIVARAPWFALIAALGVAVLPTYYQGDVNYYLQIVFGASAMLVGLGWQLRMPAWIERRLRPARADRADTPPVDLALPPEVVPAGVTAGPSAPAGLALDSAAADGAGAGDHDDRSSRGRALEVRDVVVSFGGLVALGGVSLTAQPGKITGLIGPNGAGKTTLFNVCSGLEAQKSGAVLYGSAEISRHSPSWRARHGLGRTFQQMELFDSMTVEQNVRLGREARLAGLHPADVVWTRRGQRQDVDMRAKDAMSICGLTRLSGIAVENLSTGDRRLVELARCIAADFDMVLLDEPSAGLDSAETSVFGEVLTRTVRESGTGVLLIEHDVELVMQVCSYIYVLDFGRLIFEGSPAATRSSREVQAAYLGQVEETV
jgi:ABC-type branched-subunit amino acid transport system ATPase component/branched-subunit amino acid ABC-type transport system permease component